jgi:hypothetical protein
LSGLEVALATLSPDNSYRRSMFDSTHHDRGIDRISFAAATEQCVYSLCHGKNEWDDRGYAWRGQS